MQNKITAKIHIIIVRCEHEQNKFHKTEYWLNIETGNQTYHKEINYQDAMYMVSLECRMTLQHMTKQQFLDSKGVII